MNNTRKILFVFVVTFYIQSSLFAKAPFYPTMPPWTPKAMIKYVREAHDYYLKTGDLNEFRKKTGKFTKGQLFDYRYIVVLECEKNLILTHAWLPHMEKIKNVLVKMKDANGKLFGLGGCAGSKKYPDGIWVKTNQIVPGLKKDGKRVVTPISYFIMAVKGKPQVILATAREIYLSQKELMELTYKRKFTQKELDEIVKY